MNACAPKIDRKRINGQDTKWPKKKGENGATHAGWNTKLKQTPISLEDVAKCVGARTHGVDRSALLLAVIRRIGGIKPN